MEFWMAHSGFLLGARTGWYGSGGVPTPLGLILRHHRVASAHGLWLGFLQALTHPLKPPGRPGHQRTDLTARLVPHRARLSVAQSREFHDLSCEGQPFEGRYLLLDRFWAGKGRYFLARRDRERDVRWGADLLCASDR